MNARFYGLIIYDAHVLFTEYLDLGEAYRYQHNQSKAVVESHCIYERELCEGDSIEVHSWLLGLDDKRLHFFHELYCTNKNYRACVGEQLDIHINLETRRASSFPSAVYSRLKEVAYACQQLPQPSKVGRTIKALNT